MWLKPENRCLVPFNSFAEYAPEPNPESKKKDVVWFALNDDRPLTAFAGIWTEFKGDRGTKSKPIPGPHLVYGFLTTTPNAVVEPIHAKAMPVKKASRDHRFSELKDATAYGSADLLHNLIPIGLKLNHHDLGELIAAGCLDPVFVGRRVVFFGYFTKVERIAARIMSFGSSVILVAVRC
jgi:hypothetical protein